MSFDTTNLSKTDVNWKGIGDSGGGPSSPTSSFSRRQSSSSFMSRTSGYPSTSLTELSGEAVAQQPTQTSRSSSRSSSPARLKGNPDFRFLEFAKMRNPTLSVRFSKRWTLEFTYAELLQYVSIVLCGRRLVNTYWPIVAHWFMLDEVSRVEDPLNAPPIPSSAQLLASSKAFSSSSRSPSMILFLLNLFVVLLTLATLDARRKSEHLGLRRTSLILCTVLFIFASLVSLWPPHSTSNTVAAQGLGPVLAERCIAHIDDEHPSSSSPACQPLSSDTFDDRRARKAITTLNLPAIDRMCSTTTSLEQTFQLYLSQGHHVTIACFQHRQGLQQQE